MDTASDYSYTVSTTAGLDSATTAGIVVWVIIGIVVAVIMIASLWKLFEKADKPGWAAIVPVYNYIVMLEIVGRPIWWLVLLFFVPFVNIVVAIIIMLDFAKAYGKSNGYGVLMIFFLYVMYPLLAFSKNTRYIGPVAQARPVMPTQPHTPQQ